MSRTLRVLAICLLFAVSSFAQDRPLIGTVVDVDEGSNQLEIELDDASNTRVVIETDAVSTTYHGFGTIIAGKPEIFTGSRGLANVRVNDRVEVRGPQRSEGVYRADRVILVGRNVPAPAVGVGETRDPGRGGMTTPTDDRATGVTPSVTRTEGTIREINERDGRLVVQTTDRRLLNVRVARSTPVYYRGERYNVANLELGDRVRIESDVRNAQSDEISARRIDVTQSVQDARGGTSGTAAIVTVIDGRVTRVDQNLDYVYVDDGRGEIRVDMRTAEDATGDIIRARDVQVGDRVEISGSYNRTGDLFQASTVRFGGGGGALDDGDAGRQPVPDVARYGLVTITGTVTETLQDSPTIAFRDRDTGQTVRIWVSEDFVVRTKGNTYTTAESLKVNDTAAVTAFRDVAGYYVAQTIRLRNR